MRKFSKGRILFIEDEKNLLDIYHDFFMAQGYDFLSVQNIEDALAMTQAERPDVVLLDIIIPTPNNTVAEQGYDYLRAVKENPKTKDIPVIVFTNLDTAEDRKKCREMGAAAYIFKRACKPKEVEETVAEVIRRNDKERRG